MKNELREQAITKVKEAVKFVNDRLGVEVGRAVRTEYQNDTGALVTIEVMDDYDVFNLIDKLEFIVNDDDYFFEAYSALQIHAYINVD